MVHLNDASRLFKPGAEVEKSVGSGTSAERKFIYQKTGLVIGSVNKISIT
jgi:hypothetical protein